MSQRKELGRRRVADSDDDDDNENNNNNVAQTVAATNEVTAPAVAPAKAPRAKAPAAAAAAVHADPSSSLPSAPAPPRAKAPSAAAAPTAAAVPAAASTTDYVKLIFEADYQNMKLDELLSILKNCDKKKVDEVKTEKEAARQQAQQLRQNNRIERFFDMHAPEQNNENNNDDNQNNNNNNVGSSTGATPTTAFPTTEQNAQGKGYRYEYMLTCIHDTLTKNNKGAKLNARTQLPAPQIEMIGKKKTVITNFGRLCEVFHRTPEEVKEFIEQELSANGNLDSNQALILKYQARKANDFDKLFIRYLDEYVKCNACHQINTTLTKENRILTLHCNLCTATRTVNVSHDNTYTASTEKRSIKRNAITL